jgi:hypothetical protein
MGKHEGAPRFSSTALNGRPAVHFQEGRIDGMQTTASLPGLAGNPGFTIFLVAKLSKPKAERTHPLGWGDGSKRGGGMILEFEAGRLDLATGWSSDASTPDQSFTSHFGQPTLLTCVKSPGPMNSTSRISYKLWPAAAWFPRYRKEHSISVGARHWATFRQQWTWPKSFFSTVP